MKGPSGRLKFRIRRLWRCPACGRREWTSGRVVNRACICTPPGAERPIWMMLEEEPRGTKPNHGEPSPTGA
jgi:hypothetical protein